VSNHVKEAQSECFLVRSHANKSISSQLSLQLSQNSGAREKGNRSLNVPAPILRWLSVQPALHHDQRQKLENKNYKGICGSRAAGTSVLWVSFSRGKFSVKQTCQLRSCSSRHGTSRSPALPRAGVGFSICLHLLKPASRVATLSARAGQDCQDAFVQEASWMVVGYPRFSL
jgi:hypothetical protein